MKKPADCIADCIKEVWEVVFTPETLVSIKSGCVICLQHRLKPGFCAQQYKCAARIRGKLFVRFNRSSLYRGR